MKRCSKCRETKPVAEFHRNSRAKDGLFAWCRGCQNENNRRWRETNRARKAECMRQYRQDNKDQVRATNRAWRERNRDVVRGWGLERYGLSVSDFEAMLASQGGACALCRTDDPGKQWWHVDHDHACCPQKSGPTCGKCVRAILCSRCNTSLGRFNDDPALLRRAAEYLESHGPRSSDDTHSDPCPECGTELACASGGGVRCPSAACDYWFCY